MKKLTFNQFCATYLDRMYTPGLPDEQQSTGYLQLKRMVVEGITPATVIEAARWETNPTDEELLSTPDVKYLRFLHPCLRTMIIQQWDKIKNLKV